VKKILSIIMVLMLTLTMVVGCGQEETKDMETQAGSTTVEKKIETASDDTKEKEEVKAAPEKVELKVFMSFPRFKDQFEAYFEQFKAKELTEKNIDVTM